jgi:hypothetical protein
MKNSPFGTTKPTTNGTWQNSGYLCGFPRRRILLARGCTAIRNRMHREEDKQRAVRDVHWTLKNKEGLVNYIAPTGLRRRDNIHQDYPLDLCREGHQVIVSLSITERAQTR